MKLEMKRGERVEKWLRANLMDCGVLFSAVEGLSYDTVDKEERLEQAASLYEVPFQDGFAFAAACALEGKPGTVAAWAEDYIFMFVGSEDEVLARLEALPRANG